MALQRRYTIGREYVSQGELRELRAPGAADVTVGGLLLLGHEHLGHFSDAVWAMAERGGDRLRVRPAKIRRSEKLSADGTRVVQGDGPPPAAGHASWESYRRQRDRLRDEQEATISRHLREQQELAERQLAE